jgi:hypothetical protein
MTAFAFDVAMAGLGVNGPEDETPNWDTVAWRRHEENVRRLRGRIFKATKDGDWPQVRNLQKLMLRSWSNTLVSVRQVAQRNAGRKTAGIDGQVALTWFVGSMTDETPRTLSVPLRFLRPHTPYVASIYGDAPTTDLETNPNQVAITRLIVDRRDSLRAPMVGGGGQAVHLTPATAQDVATLPHCGRSTPLCMAHRWNH